MTRRLDLDTGPDADDKPTPRLSIVVIMYDMAREAERTLYTLSSAYQRRVDPDAYEVIVVDNGSPTPLQASNVESFGPQFRLVTVEQPERSPVCAINEGVKQTRGQAVAIMVDGARMLSPGVLAWTLSALSHFVSPAIVCPSWHLGPDVQNRSVQNGYDQAVEDALLASIEWRIDGYRLFDLCERLDPSSEGAAWFGACAESNFVCCSRTVFDEVGGYDLGFRSPGGGACNLDFFRRLVEEAGCSVVSLVGEGTFHQVHGGVSTNVPAAAHPWTAIEAEYRSVRGRGWAAPSYEAILYGTLSEPAKRLLARSPNIFTHSTQSPEWRWMTKALRSLALRCALKLSPRSASANTKSDRGPS